MTGATTSCEFLLLADASLRSAGGNNLMPSLPSLPFFRRAAPADAPARSAESSLPAQPALIKVALLGDAGVGKTSLMVRYVEGGFDQTQLPTQGINFMERSISLDANEVVFSIWDIGGHADSESMLPLVCNDAAAVLLLFDLSRPETLDSVREWHRKLRALNKSAMPVLVGCKYDQLLAAPADEHALMCRAARRFAHAVSAPLVFCAPSVPINVSNIFKVILIRLFGLAHAVPQLRHPGEPLLIYEPDDETTLLDASQAASPPPEGGGGGGAGSRGGTPAPVGGHHHRAPSKGSLGLPVGLGSRNSSRNSSNAQMVV